jgi:hypothetical protein
MARWVGAILFMFLYGCGDEKSSLSGDAPVDKADFVDAFPDLKLPKTIYDTGLARIGDTTTISYAVFTQFVPDSAFRAIITDNKKGIIKPVGKIKSADELYLLAKLVQDKKYTLGVFVFDNDNKYLGGKELLTNRFNDGYLHTVNINREPTFMIGREKITPDNRQFYTRTGYAYNKDAGFMIVVNDSNEDLKKQDSIINPIDTFARANKFSGDYIKDKKNFISLRDGRNATTYLFFVHFEKSNGECKGELKGELVMKNESTGQYTAGGDPCVINFRISNSQVQMKEEGSCGNHRDIKCFFDDQYNKKREPKTKQKRK